MYFSKKNLEPVPEEQTAIWACSKDQCSCWMREDFSFEKSPTCPLCNSPMVKNTKMLPSLLNNNKL